MRFGCPGIIRSAWNPCRSLKRIARGKNPICRSSQASTLRRAFSGAEGFHGRSSARGTTGTPIDDSQRADDSSPSRLTATSAVAEPLVQLREDAALDEDAGRELLGEDDPDPLAAHRAADAPTATSTRAAIEAASRPCARSASGGVPQAGQPSTPSTSTVRPWSSPVAARARRSASPSAPTGA